MSIDIDLRDHVGVNMRSGEEQSLNQWIVIVSVGGYFGPKQIGYLSKAPGSVLAPISTWNTILRSDREPVLAAISEAAGWEVAALDYPTQKIKTKVTHGPVKQR